MSVSRPVLLLLTLLGACSDYELNPKEDALPGRDTNTPDDEDTGPDSVIVDACNGVDEPPVGDVSLNTECEVELSTGTFTPQVEWTYGSSAYCGPAGVAQTMDTNGSGGIDDDDLPLVFIYQNQRVVALYGDSGSVAWTTSGAYGQDGGFAIGDVDDDGWPDIVTADGSKVCALEGDTGSEKWCRNGLSDSLDPLGYSYPSIADMDGDGKPEVTAGRTILNGLDGTVRGQGDYGIGAAPYGGSPGSFYGALSVPIDLDGDGQLELVTGNAAYDVDGNTIWANGGLDGLIAVADFDGDGQGEIVKTTGIYVYGMETDGTEVWGPITFSGNLGAPAADDMDGDGLPEFVFAAQNKLIAMHWDQSLLWRADISDASGAAGPTLFDFEMDGYPEVLYADETSVRFFSGLDGSVKYQSNEHGSYTILETPVVADVDGDDQVEIVVGHCDAFSSYTGVTVYGDADQTWPPGRKIWNQHAYYITNVGDHGEIPSPTANNYSLYNSFRSGDVGRPPSEYWDLTTEILDVCEDECDDGKVYVAARVANNGNIEAPAGLPVSLRAGAGGPILDSVLTTAAIPSGKTGELLRFEVDAGSIGGTVPIVTADEDLTGGSAIFECDEGNNAGAWSDTVCN